MILAIETSCDDTCAAVITPAGAVRSNVISSQEIHDRFGGVVPEVASRHHLELVNVVIDEALRRAGIALGDVGLVAATRGPGLVGALLVGFSTAKSLAAGRGLPFAPVDHLHGHVAASLLGPEPFATAGGGGWEPFICLVASGGHTFIAHVADPSGYTVLGATLDDAAGEAFDKGARMLGLPFPGGPHLQRLATGGDPAAFAFPTAANLRGLDMSFSGLKTALLYRIRDLGEAETAARAADLAASFQHAIVESLAIRVERAVAQTGVRRVAIGGGVAANGPLRERIAGLDLEAVHIPEPALCTDNAAMIASAARFVPALEPPDYLALDVYATGSQAA